VILICDDENRSLKQKAVNGVFWRFGEQGANRAIPLFIFVILARLIMPDLSGMAAFVTFPLCLEVVAMAYLAVAVLFRFPEFAELKNIRNYVQV